MAPLFGVYRGAIYRARYEWITGRAGRHEWRPYKCGISYSSEYDRNSDYV